MAAARVRLVKRAVDHDPTDACCGLDEAGRGALAGPLVVAAVALPAAFSFERAYPDLVVRDSKLLSVRQRERLAAAIWECCTAAAVCEMPAATINDRGINWANTEAFARLICAIDAADYVVDGRWKIRSVGVRDDRVRCLVRADCTVPAALAAGVLAKQHRDRIMQRLAADHPAYGWTSNTGHGTAGHIAAIRRLGVTDQHRTQFVATALRAPGVPRRGRVVSSV